MATNLEFIKEVNAVQTANVNVTDIFTTKYDVYKIYARFTGNSSTGYLATRFIDAGGSVISDGEYHNAAVYMRTYDTYFEGRGTTNTSMILTYNQDFGGGGADFTIYNPADSSKFTFAKGVAMGGTNSGGYGWNTERISMHDQTEAISGISFLSGSGSQDYEVLQVSVYGVVE